MINVARAFVLGAFVVAGAFTGYLMGLSSSPVVASVLPLILGVTGGVSYGLLHGQWKHSSLTLALKNRREQIQANLMPNQDAEQAKRIAMECQKVLDELFETDATSNWLPGFYAGAVILFCMACFGGAKLGYCERRAHESGYTSFDQLIPKPASDATKPTLEQNATLFGAYLRAKQLRLSPEDTKLALEILGDVSRKKTVDKSPPSDTGNSPLADARESIFSMLKDGGSRVSVPDVVLLGPSSSP